MDAGTLTSRALTAAYLARIAAIDDAGPALNSVIELNPAALADAERLDAERKAGKVRGPMHGIPVLLKDNIDVVGMIELGRFARARRQQAGRRRLPGRAPARRRRRPPRQDEPQRVGELPLHPIELGLELARRADEEPLRARPQPLRVECRHRHRHCREPGRGGHRHRDRRQHPVPGGRGGPGGPQAHGGPRQPPRHHPDLDLAGHGRTDDAHRRRYGDAAHRDGGRGRWRSGRRGRGRQDGRLP